MKFRIKSPPNPIDVEDRTPIFIDITTEKLIIGTMISYCGRYLLEKNSFVDKTCNFFYPNENKNHLWKFLFRIFSNTPLKTKIRHSQQEKETLLRINHIGMANLIKRAICKEGSSKDSDIKIIEFRKELLPKIESSKINSIFFTSKNTHDLFYSFLQKEQISVKFKDSAQTRTSIKSIVTLFNRDFILYVLPNPTSRGRKGETVENKYLVYKSLIQS